MEVPTGMYQMVLMHQDHGRDVHVDYPAYDLGTFTPVNAQHCANFLLALTQHLDLEMFEGVPTNLPEAWGCLSYRCWLLPLEPGQPCLEIVGDGISEVNPTNDPR